MRKLILVSLTTILLCCAAAGQQPQPTPGPLTFYYDYTVFPGKEEELMNLIKTVGAPVRDKLMADGVILAWGLETPVLRYPGGTTHLIWFTVANWDGVEKVLNGMEAQLARLATEEAQAAEAARAKRQKPAMTTAGRSVRTNPNTRMASPEASIGALHETRNRGCQGGWLERVRPLRARSSRAARSSTFPGQPRS